MPRKLKSLEPFRQEVVWVPQAPASFGPRSIVDVAEKPDRVWTILRATNPTVKPILPFTPTHNWNAFLEDYLHDWNWTNGKLKYGSRISDGGLWILLEYGVKP